MKRILLTMAAVPVMLAAAPLLAQTRADAGMWNDTGISNRISQLGSRIQAGIRSGEINRVEARRIRPGFLALQRLHARYRVNGLSLFERNDLRARMQNLRQEIRLADRGSWDRYERFAFDDDRFIGRGGPLGDEDDDGICTQGRGIGGLLERLIDRDDDCLRVGDFAQGALYGVPSHLRFRYRDNAHVYFRTNGRNIVQIDRRTNRVVGVHPM